MELCTFVGAKFSKSTIDAKTLMPAPRSHRASWALKMLSVDRLSTYNWLSMLFLSILLGVQKK